MMIKIARLLSVFLISNICYPSASLSENTSDTAVAKTTLNQSHLDAYTNFQEWHFELKLSEAQKSNYQNLLSKDFAAGIIVTDLLNAPKTIEGFKKSDWLNIASFHSQQKQIDSIEASTQEILGDNQIYGNGIRAQTLKEAKRGATSSDYLLKAIDEYQKPISGSGNVHNSLFQSHIDGTIEWTAFRIATLSGKSFEVIKKANSQELKNWILDKWKNIKSENERQEFLNWLETNKNNWLIWRIGEYSFLGRMTPYQRKNQEVEWANEICKFSPQFAPLLQQKISEYKAYVAKMSDSEIKSEFELKKKSDTKFAAQIAQMQNEMKISQANFAHMRQSMQSLHVANLNIAENLGSSGYEWKIK